MSWGGLRAFNNVPRPTTAKALTEEQKQLTAGIVRLVNHFVRNHKPDGFTCADFRSEMYLAVVKGASRYEASKGSFSTWVHRFMEQHARHLRWDAYQKSTYRHRGVRHPRRVRVLYLDPETLGRAYRVHRELDLVRFSAREHHLSGEH